ncbi:unnamed protein product [Spodoptera littoralis]|uniref:G-patch domain-containing protein n=1 Tax=Spodoptera littoralis TaxID=7109 RepID=A0A9P0N657_SPOLI|nr:unnamed protein product [Spodoptera littoralis]CAH1642934.1 unnamed protein product [Spodoptera littoralis]
MSGFYNEQDFYANTYSLWGNSKYYDIKNLSPQNFANRNGTIGSELGQEFRATRWVPEKEVKKPPPDYFDRRTITRESLYQDPDKNKKIKEDTCKKWSPAIDWTLGYWEKPDWVNQDEKQPGSSLSKKQVLDGAKIQKKLADMLSKPVKMSKAESMMQKMGWQGGALGRSGDGIVEPIAPNAVYSSNKVGFGQLQHIKPPEPKPGEKKQYFETNVLHIVYEFVKNNNEIELLFDRKLRREERKRIHNIVQLKLQADDLTTVDFDTTAQVELVLQINNHNCYMLHTKSYGTFPERQLCLFKVAPDHVYLVTPHQLRHSKERDIEDELLEVDCTEEIVPEPQVNQVEKLPEVKKPEELEPEETNPFLISITRNLKKNSESESKEDTENPEIPEIPENPKIPEVPKIPEAEKKPEKPVVPEMSEIMKLIVECYMEFKGRKKFSQFKFMGPFDEAQTDAVNEFMQQATMYLNKEPCTLASVFENVEFKIKEDCTGNAGIFKRPVRNRVK